MAETKARRWTPTEPCEEGQHEAHEAHMEVNGECPWCGATSLAEQIRFMAWLSGGAKDDGA